MVLVNEESGGATITLPTAVGNEGKEYLIKKIGNTANVIVDGESGETIDGATTVTLDAQYEYIRVVSNGTAWYIIGSNL